MSVQPTAAAADGSALSSATPAAYHKVSSYEAHAGTFARCLLLYSGGLDTSVMLKWIQESYRCDVYCLTIDLGQTADDLAAIRAKALKLGAKDCVVYDAKEEFAEKYLSHAIKANADYQGGYALGCPLGRVMISEVAVKEARRLACEVVAHGSTGKGNDQVRFEGYILTLNPNLKIIAPVREWGMGRDEEIAYAQKHGIPIKQKADVPYSWDENAWSNTGEGGEIENPELKPKLPSILQWCKTIENSAPEAETVDIEFFKGIPVALDGQKKRLYPLIAELNRLGAKHGVGVTQLIEDRVVGLKVRGVYENPAAAILIAAHKKLEYLVSTREENEFSAIVQNKWAYLTYGAKWFDPLMDHLRAFIDDQNEKVTGNVSVKLFRGNIIVESLKSPYSLFNHSLATFNRSAAFNQNASPGFIELYTLAMRTAQGVKERRLEDERKLHSK